MLPLLLLLWLLLLRPLLLLLQLRPHPPMGSTLSPTPTMVLAQMVMPRITMMIISIIILLTLMGPLVLLLEPQRRHLTVWAWAMEQLLKLTLKHNLALLGTYSSCSTW